MSKLDDILEEAEVGSALNGANEHTKSQIKALMLEIIKEAYGDGNWDWEVSGFIDALNKKVREL